MANQTKTEISTRTTKKTTSKPRRKVKTANGDIEEPISKLELSRWIVSGILFLTAILLLLSFLSNLFQRIIDIP